MISEKEILRRKIKKQWRDLSLKNKQDLAKKAFDLVSELKDFLNAENIFIYAPKGDEINFVPKLCEKFPDKNYSFPKIIDREICFFRGIFLELKVGKWGILEPETSSLAPQPNKADFIFVPAVGADFAGNRLGNGGGFYDRFLAENPAKTVCVLPGFAVFREIPIEEYDVRVDEIVVV